MIDISSKQKTLRIASCRAEMKMKKEILQLVKEGTTKKGNPQEVARVAAVMAAKNNSSIIPFCHPISIDYVGVNYSFEDPEKLIIDVEVKAVEKTGVEMEALTAGTVCALTIYDMVKMYDSEIEISSIKITSKKGGKSDFKEKIENTLKSAVVVMSDSIFAKKKDDTSGKMIVERLKAENFDVVHYSIIPDEKEMIISLLKELCDEKKVDLILTTGGTGFSPRDNTPEAMKEVIEKEIPGIPEAIRNYGMERTPYSMLSRGKAGIRGKTIIINLPGSKRGVKESLDAIFPAILHSFKMIEGGGH